MGAQTSIDNELARLRGFWKVTKGGLPEDLFETVKARTESGDEGQVVGVLRG